METSEIEKYTGYADMSIVEAMSKIDLTGAGILFIISESKQLIGSLTDGDIRRWLINTGNLQINVENIMHKDPHYIFVSEAEEARQKLASGHDRALPIVDQAHRIVSIMFNNCSDEIINDHISNVLENIPVVIMAGGVGSRLLPYTSILPKPLIPVGEKPVLERIIEQFCKYGCREFYLVLNYRKNMIKAYFNEIDHTYKIHYIDEEEPLGTGGGLFLLKDTLKSTFILSNCDILIREDFSDILHFHEANANGVSMISSLKTFHIPYGVIHTTSQGVIEKMEEKPSAYYMVNTGCYMIQPDFLNMFEEKKRLEMPEIIEQYCHSGKKVGVYPISETAWLDMGQPEELERMKKFFE